MNNTPEEEKIEQELNYHFSSEAVEALANADTEEIPQYSEEELKKYRKKKFQIPMLAKVLFIKAWFYGAVCYFVLMGLGLYLRGLDMYVVLAMIMGMATDLLTNNVLRFIEELPGENHKYLFVNKRGVIGLFANVLYHCILVYLVMWLYESINVFAELLHKDPTRVFLGVEPILFGIFAMGIDMVFVGFKRLLSSIVNDAKESARRQEK